MRLLCKTHPKKEESDAFSNNTVPVAGGGNISLKPAHVAIRYAIREASRRSCYSPVAREVFPRDSRNSGPRMCVWCMPCLSHETVCVHTPCTTVSHGVTTMKLKNIFIAILNLPTPLPPFAMASASLPTYWTRRLTS